tara:strand:+ start:29650 stop:30063 length:414 start_codon:yes stop_codon:yes gene_type:complete
MEKHYSLEELCQLLGISRRTIRYYIQEGLVQRPLGQKRGAYYTDAHLKQLQQLQAWQSAGYSLDRIRELMAQDASPEETLLALQPKLGDVSVWSHIHISQGVELHINPEKAGLSPAMTRKLFQQIGILVEQLEKDGE